jgi:hypothetical protein
MGSADRVRRGRLGERTPLSILRPSISFNGWHGSQSRGAGCRWDHGARPYAHASDLLLGGRYRVSHPCQFLLRCSSTSYRYVFPIECRGLSHCRVSPFPQPYRGLMPRGNHRARYGDIASPPAWRVRTIQSCGPTAL